MSTFNTRNYEDGFYFRYPENKPIPYQTHCIGCENFPGLMDALNRWLKEHNVIVKGIVHERVDYRYFVTISYFKPKGV